MTVFPIRLHAGRGSAGGWLLVDRVTGHVSPVKLAEFDAYYSAVGCYRDSVADGGVSEDGEKKYALGTQLCRRKPILKKELSRIRPA